jgi:PAS domain S-box-containing protein
MGGDGSTHGERIKRRLAPSLAVGLAFAALEAGALPPAAARLASNLLQLALAATAAFSCFRAAARERALARSFFVLIGFGMALWALAQGLWTLGSLGRPVPLLVAFQDVLFVSCAAPFIAACVVKPDRPRPGALGLAADVGLVSALALFVYVYFPVALAALGAADPYQDLAPVLFNPQRLILLGALLWLLHGSASAWRRLYQELALAMVVFHAGGMLSNLTLFAGTYRPGLHDLPWALPFLWLALAAREWRPTPLDPARREATGAAGWEAGSWKRARDGNLVALAAVVLVPGGHQLATILGSPSPELHALRGRITLAGTLLVGGLYLARQLYILRGAEGTQRAREERFRALVEHSADAIGLLDGAGRFSYVSASSERVTGYRPDELVGRSALELVDPGEHGSIGRAFGEIRARPGATAQGFVRYLHRDGGFRDGSIDAVNRLDTPAVRGVVLHLRDVTEQRRAEQERERSLSLLQATIESTADGILVIGRDGRIERFNRKFASMWRVPREVLESHDDEGAMGHALDQLQYPDAFLDKLRKLYAEPEAESFDVLPFRDGRVFERYSLPQRLAGEVVGRVWSFRDVSERSHAEGAMARLVAIIEATPDFVGMSDPSGNPLHINRAGRRMVGLAEEEPLVGSHIAQFHTPGAAALLLEQAIPRALREGSWSGENVLRHEGGSEIPVLQVVLAHRSPRGEVEFLSTIARDISQRIRAEQELRQSQTMAALGALVAGVAHEVRNPLFGISSTLDAFEARFASRGDQAQYVRVLRQQLERLTSLMNDLLDYAKPTRLELQPGRLEDVLAQALDACAALKERSQATIETRLAPDLPPLRMDQRRLGQVFRNLLENGLQHAAAHGRVHLTARLVGEGAAARVECSVEDDGPGFRLEDLPHLFEPFFTRRHGGTGLGLSIVQRIVSDHGGFVAASNREGGGARLSLSLPVTPPAGEAP